MREKEIYMLIIKYETKRKKKREEKKRIRNKESKEMKNEINEKK